MRYQKSTRRALRASSTMQESRNYSGNTCLYYSEVWREISSFVTSRSPKLTTASRDCGDFGPTARVVAHGNHHGADKSDEIGPDSLRHPPCFSFFHVLFSYGQSSDLAEVLHESLIEIFQDYASAVGSVGHLALTRKITQKCAYVTVGSVIFHGPEREITFVSSVERYIPTDPASETHCHAVGRGAGHAGDTRPFCSEEHVPGAVEAAFQVFGTVTHVLGVLGNNERELSFEGPLVVLRQAPGFRSSKE